MKVFEGERRRIMDMLKILKDSGQGHYRPPLCLLGFVVVSRSYKTIGDSIIHTKDHIKARRDRVDIGSASTSFV